MKPLHTALLIIVAMLAGAGISYWAIRQMPPPAPSLPAAKTESAGESPVARPRMLAESSALDEAALEAAVAAAKEARQRGELKPVATTPEEFARELGRFNFRLVDFLTSFPAQPVEGTPEEKTYRERIDQLTRDYANLTLDEDLLAGAPDDTPDQLAHVQAHLAGGSLELDAAGVAKLEAILRRVYEKLFPLEGPDEDAVAKLDAATNEITRELSEFLTPEQHRRLELMGTDQVLFGLPQPEP